MKKLFIYGCLVSLITGTISPAYSINLFRKKVKSIEATQKQVSLLENYVTNTINNATKEVMPLNKATQFTVLETLSILCQKSEYKKLVSKIKKIEKNKKLSDSDKITKISELLVKVTEKNIHTNDIALIARATRLSKTQQMNLEKNANLLATNAQIYYEYIKKWELIKQSMVKMSSSTTDLTKIIDTVNKATVPTNNMTKLSINLSNRIYQLLKEANINY